MTSSARWVPYVAVAGMFGGQQIIAPVIPPLGRSLGLSEVQVGLFITVSSAVILLASPLWGRAVSRFGHKPVIVASLLGVALALLGFAVVAQVAVATELSPAVTFWLLLLFRGAGFGMAAAAVPVAVQSYLASNTATEVERVRSLGLYGASYGLGGVLGPSLGGLLATFGLLAPLYVPPVLIVVIAALVWVRFPPDPEPAVASVAERRQLSPFDPRIWPYLLVGVVLFVALTALPVTVGFLVQDRLELSAEQAAQQTGIALLGYGIMSLLAQGLLVRRLGWSPLTLLRVGIPISTVALAVLAFAPSLVTIVLATALFGLGHGLALPGYTAAPTLRVERHEQGGLAGLIGATNGAGSIGGPLFGTPLYAVTPGAPFLAGAALLAALTAFVHWRRLTPVSESRTSER
jgi:DHA1 family tetracycline resistance protein-like MFS transporter